MFSFLTFIKVNVRFLIYKVRVFGSFSDFEYRGVGVRDRGSREFLSFGLLRSGSVKWFGWEGLC